MKGVSRRIRSTEDDERSGEQTAFFDESQRVEVEELPECPKDSAPVTLSQLAESLEIEPATQTVMSRTLDDRKTQSIVSEIILEDND